MNLHLFGDMSSLGLPNQGGQQQSNQGARVGLKPQPPTTSTTTTTTTTTTTGSSPNETSTSAQQRILIPFYLVQPLTYTDNQVLSRAYSSFLVHQRRQTADGASVGDLVGNGYVDVSALVGGAGLNSADPVSRFIVSLLLTFGLTRLPEKLGLMHLLYVLLQVC